MVYSDFTLDMLLLQFALSVESDHTYFAGFRPVPISDLLRQELAENVPVALDIATEKARSELIIMPVLMEVRRQCERAVSLFSGIPFNVAPEEGLAGRCDFLLSLSPVRITVQAPVVAIVEAKNEDMKSGIAQCVAELVAAQRFNQVRGNRLPAVYGVVTTGAAWRFLRLQGKTVLLDDGEHSIELPEKVLGILVGVLRDAAGSISGR